MALLRAHLAAWTAALLASWAAGAYARPPSQPPVPIEVRAEGVVVTGTFKGAARSRYQLTPPAKGTLVVSLQPIHGASPRMLLRKADGRIIRRDRNGQLWTRSPANEPLVLELYARPDADDAGVYLLRAIFDADRPREERNRIRPARPGDVVTVSKHGQRIERVLVDGIQAEFKDHGANVLVTVPAFARTGALELHTEGGPAHAVTYELVGAEPAAPDVAGDACALVANVGCIQLSLAPSVGSAWLKEIARVVDADIVAHSQKTGAVLLKVRLTSSEGFALATLSAMPGVRSARHAIPDSPR